MCKIKDYIEQHPDEKFPEDAKVASDEGFIDEDYNWRTGGRQDEDSRLDYQQQREDEVSSSMDSYFAPSQGY
jgi:hypothetical protein